MTVQRDNNLIKPNPINAPSEQTLRVLNFIGIAILMAGIFIMGYIIWWEVYSDESYRCGWNETCNSGFDFYHWVVPVVVGTALIVLAYNRKDYFYCNVSQGQVVNKDFEVVGSMLFTSSYHTLYIKGYNRAGQITTGRISVKEGFYAKTNIGDYVDFR
jgi:hypothetical protein